MRGFIFVGGDSLGKIPAFRDYGDNGFFFVCVYMCGGGGREVSWRLSYLNKRIELLLVLRSACFGPVCVMCRILVL